MILLERIRYVFTVVTLGKSVRSALELPINHFY